MQGCYIVVLERRPSETVCSQWKKLVLSAFICICLLVVSTGYSQALTNENVYRDCKPFADRGFATSNASESDVHCVLFIAGILQTSDYLCEVGVETDSGGLIALSTGNASKQHYAVIQAYINKMAKHPEIWKEFAAPHVLREARNLAPCD